MTESHTEASNTRRTLGGKKPKLTMAEKMAMVPKTPAIDQVAGTLPRSVTAGGTENSTPADPALIEGHGGTPAAPQPVSVPAPPAAPVPRQPGRAEQPRPARKSVPAPVTVSVDISDEDDDEDGIDEGDSGHRVSTYVRGDTVKAARRSGLVFGALTINAIDAALQEGILQDLIQQRNTGTVDSDSRFPPRKQSRRVRTKAKGASTRVLWQPAFTLGELEELDKVLQEVGAKNRSQLISVALEWYLGPRLGPSATAVNLDD